MSMQGVGLIGWLHTAACVVALVAGAFMLAMPKGTPTHRMVGRWYVLSMVIVNVSVFAIYHFDVQFAPPKVGPGIFGLFHWMAAGTLAVLLFGFFAASRQRYAFFAYAHPASMLISYYMLVGGLINELFVRVPYLRDIARAAMPAGQANGQSPVVGMAQFGCMVVFIGILVWFMVKVALYRRRSRRVSTMPAPAE
jgi:uncharacterized membrane protein